MGRFNSAGALRGESQTVSCLPQMKEMKQGRYCLKGQCHEIFELYCFHELNPDKQAKKCFLKIRFREDIRI